MNALRDVLLNPPLEHPWIRGLLMFTFSLHLLFVLLTLGTAMLGGGLLVAGGFGRRGSLRRWGHEVLRGFFVHKSLAIVLGVAPILLMQVGHSVPFLTGVNLFAPLWLWIVVLLATALLLIEAAGEGWAHRRWTVLLCVAAGLCCLLAVPGIFAAVVVATENPSRWSEILARGGRLTSGLAAHWALRLAHVIAASLVFTAAFHYLRSRNQQKRRMLSNWMIGGLMVQFILGTALYASLPRRPQPLIAGTILAGVALAAAWAWQLYRSRSTARELPVLRTASLALALFVAMLLGRQLLQDQVLVPVGAQLAANRDRYQQVVVAAARGSPLARQTRAHIAPHGNAPTIYLRSCDFCHGMVGNGQGDAAPRLLVPPEDLTGLRLSDAAFRNVLLSGVRGTGMPRFGFYTRGELDRLADFLRTTINMKSSPEPVEHGVSPEAEAEAVMVFATTCSTCHGSDGRPTRLAAGFEPPPPDLSELSLSPDRAFAVISTGYPGTMMPAFENLAETTRWRLVTRVHRLYQFPAHDDRYEVRP